MLDLISTTEEIHYENYRQQQMETRPPGVPKATKSDNPRFREEEESLRKRFTEQVDLVSFFLNERTDSCFRSNRKNPVSVNGNNTSSPSVTNSIKTSKSLTEISKLSKQSWTTCKLGIIEVLRDAERYRLTGYGMSSHLDCERCGSTGLFVSERTENVLDPIPTHPL